MHAPAASARTSALALAGFLALTFAVAALGGLATASGVGSWYQGLAKPAFTPPDWIFGPVWSAIYFMIAVAGWRVWRRAGFTDRAAFAAYGCQLALNLLWSVLFFALKLVGAAFLELVALWIAIAATLVLFWRVDRPAGLLFVPYLAWVSFAGALNAAIWRLN